MRMKARTSHRSKDGLQTRICSWVRDRGSRPRFGAATKLGEWLAVRDEIERKR